VVGFPLRLEIILKFEETRATLRDQTCDSFGHII
jgi:hypothetical protein